MLHRSWTSPMTAAERSRGWVFFLLYLFAFPYLNLWFQRLLSGDAEPLIAEANVIYYALIFLLCLALFWRFLRQDLSQLIRFPAENLLGVATGFVAAGALRWLAGRLPLPVTDPVPGQYAEQYRLSPAATLLLILVLIPVVEELLFRGLLFGTLRQRSRAAAYAVTVLACSLSQVWRFVLERGDGRCFFLAVLYLPISLALTWCYDGGGSVWGCAILHGAIHAAMLTLEL